MDELLELLRTRPDLRALVEADLALPPEQRQIVRSGSVSAAPESVVMSGLREHAPSIAGLIDSARRALRPVPGPNPFAAAAGLLGLNDPLSLIEGPGAAAAGPMARAGKEVAERVRAAAVRAPDGRVFRGLWHVDARDKYLKGAEYDPYTDPLEYGFVTSSGRFVGREEAAKIAAATRQVRKDAEPSSRLDSADLAGYFATPGSTPSPFDPHAMIGRAIGGGLFGALNPQEDQSRTEAALGMAATRAALGGARGLLGAR